MPDPRVRHRLIAAVSAGVAFVILAGIGTYGLLTGPRDTTTPDHPVASESVTAGPSSPIAPPTPGPSVTPRLPSVPRSADPETFARNIATALFAWDTGTGFMPLDYTPVILAVSDLSGAEQAGLAADIAAYLPSRDAWLELRKYITTQHLAIEKIRVPQAWETALSQARPGQLADGTIAYTIEGTRHRDSVWNNEPVTSEHAVSFTVFIVCAPTYTSCSLLRLSQLDNPLK